MAPEPISVLLVDDSEPDALLTRRVLSRASSTAFAVDWASTYRNGLAQLAARPYEVVLIDLHLDENDGLQFIRSAIQGGAKAPMIVLTGEGDVDVEKEAIQAGAADYLVKGQFDAVLIERVIRHAIERQRVQAALGEERQRLKTLINTLPDVIYFKDRQSRFILCNTSQLTLLGLESQAQAVGRTDADFFPPDMANQYLRDERRLVETGEPMINKEETTVDPSGHSRWILTSKLPLHGPDGTVIGIVGLGRDITALKHAELELRRARDELEVRVRDRTAELSKAITALQAEISRRETVESQLRETEEQYRTIFEQALDAIMVVDAETGRFVDFNDQACVQLGYERADFARLTLADIDAGNGADSFGQHIQRIFAIGSEVFETQHRTKSGAIRSVIVSSRPITLRGRPVLLAFFHDITDRKQIEDELRDAVVRLETHNKAKSEFVANVSHELKTPLTSMMYGTRNLLKGIAGPLPDKVVSYLKMFDTECQRLVGTINDILDLGKLDNRALTLSPVTAPLGRLVARSIDPLRLQADAAGLELDVSVSPEAAFVKCDPDMLQRVIQNLMSNATKFTPRAGKIRFTGGLAADHPGMVAIAVTDTGVGIPAEAITHIAERYFRAGSHASGSGLGLAISKEIVALHGGTFNVLSPPPGQSHGTQVTITIPVAPAPLVLVVDDDRAMQDLIARQLGPRGYRVESVDRGETALARIEAGHHDVVIMDLILEGISGADAILALKSSSAFRYVPILAVTGATINEATADILTRFSIPTLPKPWDDEALVDTIESVLLGKTAFQFSG